MATHKEATRFRNTFRTSDIFRMLRASIVVFRWVGIFVLCHFFCHGFRSASLYVFRSATARGARRRDAAGGSASSIAFDTGSQQLWERDRRGSAEGCERWLCVSMLKKLGFDMIWFWDLIDTSGYMIIHHARPFVFCCFFRSSGIQMMQPTTSQLDMMVCVLSWRFPSTCGLAGGAPDPRPRLYKQSSSLGASAWKTGWRGDRNMVGRLCTSSKWLVAHHTHACAGYIHKHAINQV